MAKERFEFSCPCCGQSIEVNTRTGKARAIDPKAAKGGQDLDSLLDAHARESDRLGSAFDEARRDEDRAGERFDRLFDDAKRHADENPDKKPRNPFDLD